MADDAFAAFEAEMEALPAPKAAAGPQAPKVIMAAPSGPTRRRSPSPPKGLPSHLPPSQWQSPDELASQIRADNPGVAMPQLGAAAPAAPGYGAPPPPPPPEGPLAYLVRTTGKDEATCRFFLECGGGDPEQARLIMQQNGRI